MLIVENWPLEIFAVCVMNSPLLCMWRNSCWRTDSL